MTPFLDLTPHRARFAPCCPRSAMQEWGAMERRATGKRLLAASVSVMAGILAGAGVIMILWRLFP
jgi:hypothetical protein